MTSRGGTFFTAISGGASGDSRWMQHNGETSEPVGSLCERSNRTCGRRDLAEGVSLARAVLLSFPFKVLFARPTDPISVPTRSRTGLAG